LKRLGLEIGTLSQISPLIIIVSIALFGQSGFYSDFKASAIFLQASGVLLGQQGNPDRSPARTSVPQAYIHAGADAAEGTMVAH
jgi:crotonobetainyl-CoA:carnitine CoA-transferase CaiB-like acyl-CoA transferase